MAPLVSGATSGSLSPAPGDSTSLHFTSPPSPSQRTLYATRRTCLPSHTSLGYPLAPPPPPQVFFAIHDAAHTSSHGPPQICAAAKPPHPRPPRPATLPLHGDSPWRFHVVLFDVPSEEGRPSPPWLETPVGALNNGARRCGVNGPTLQWRICDMRCGLEEKLQRTASPRRRPNHQTCTQTLYDSHHRNYCGAAISRPLPPYHSYSGFSNK